MPDSRENQGYGPTAKETKAGSPTSAKTQPDAETKTGGPEFVNTGETPMQEAEIKPKEFNAEEFRNTITNEFLKIPFTSTQVLVLLGLDPDGLNKQKASFVLQKMVEKGTLIKHILIKKAGEKIPNYKPVAVYSFDKSTDFTKLNPAEFSVGIPGPQTKKKATTSVQQRKVKNFISELNSALAKIDAALKVGPNDKKSNWKLYKSKGQSSQYTLAEIKALLGLTEKNFAQQVIDKLIEIGIIKEAAPTKDTKKYRSTETQSEAKQKDIMYSIDFTSYYFYQIPNE